jgi:SAM-dependent methyltransferase
VNRPDLEWWGIERDPEYLASLRQLLRHVICADLEELEELPGGFDLVIAGDVIEHLSDWQRTLRAIHDSLAPGGRLLLSVPNVANIAMRAQLLFGVWNYTDRGILDRTHRVFFTRRSLREALRASGFEVVRESVSTIPLALVWPRLPRPVQAFLLWGLGGLTRLLPRLLGYQLLVTAGKA